MPIQDPLHHHLDLGRGTFTLHPVIRDALLHLGEQLSRDEFHLFLPHRLISAVVEGERVEEPSFGSSEQDGQREAMGAARLGRRAKISNVRLGSSGGGDGVDDMAVGDDGLAHELTDGGARGNAISEGRFANVIRFSGRGFASECPHTSCVGKSRRMVSD